MARANSKGMLPNGRKEKAGQFTRALHDIFHHPDYVELSLPARAFLWDLTTQYNGYNNGNLSAAEGVMGKFGYTRYQCCRLRSELKNRGWIEVTRRARARQPTLLRLTWLPVDRWAGPPYLSEEAYKLPVRSLKQ